MRVPLFCLVPAVVLLAQPTSPMLADEASYRKVLAIRDPAAQLTAILHFFEECGNSRSVPLMINRAFGLAERTGPPSRERALEFASDTDQRLAKASSMARSEAARTIALRLLARDLALPEAEHYARQAIAALDAADYVTRERQSRRQGDASFSVEEAREKYRSVEAAAWSTLGRVLIRQGRDADARQALQRSLAAARTAEAASAFAGLAAKQGDTHTVLDALGTAILTGKADRLTIDKFQIAYRESGMRPDPERWLDRRYRMESRNPLDAEPYRGPTPSPRRAVLLEVVTRAACEPCVAVDLAVDALLHRYSRQDVVLIAHHVPAPPTDPLASAAAGQRAKFYGLRGTPAVLLDGEAVYAGQGTAAVARPVFDSLDAAIQKRLAVPATARLQLQSSGTGPALNVEALVEDADGALLQLYLVETEVSYSGVNGIRLHPMVARGAASVEEVKGASFRARFAPSPDRGRGFAVVAVVQEMKTRRVLQSAFLAVEEAK